MPKRVKAPTPADELQAWAWGGGPAAGPPAPQRAESGARVTPLLTADHRCLRIFSAQSSRGGQAAARRLLPGRDGSRTPLLQACTGAASLWTVPRPVSSRTHMGLPGASNVATAAHFGGSASCFGGHSTGLYLGLHLLG